MAGIFEGISSDISRLRELRQEINGVKSALQGISIKVDIDIKEGLEKQLQALSNEYENLAKRISATEGRIAASINNINNATSKIIGSQEITLKRTDDSYDKSKSQEIMVQAQSYGELKREIDAIVGSREENARMIVNESLIIQQLKDEIKQINKSIQENGTATAGQRTRLAELNDELETHKAAMSQSQQVLKNQAKLDNAANDSMKGLAQQLAKMKDAYRELTAEERESPFGKELVASIQQADEKLKELDASIGNYQRNVGNYPEELSGKIGNLLGLNGQLGESFVNLAKSSPADFFGGLKTNVAAFGKTVMGFIANPYFLAFVGLAAAKAFKWWYDYNKGLIEASRLTSQFTGLTGDTMKAMRNEVSAVADFYGKDFKEVLMATNAVSKQFGISQSKALKLIRDGFIAGADANGEFLENLKEYPAYFKEAGLEASEFIAITTQANQAGVFSDKGVDLIKEGNIRLREMTKATSDALDAIGINSKKVKKDLADGKKTTFDVIKEVSQKIKELPESSAQVGTALADIFGGPGEDAGLQYVELLSTIETNLDKVKEKAGRLGEIEEEQIKATADLNNAVASLFDATGGTFEEMTANFKLFGTEVLTKIVDGLIDICNYFIDLYNNSMMVRGAFENILTPFQLLYRIISNQLKVLTAQFVGLGQIIKGIFTFNFDEIEKGLVTAFGAIGETAIKNAEDLYELFKNKANNVKNGKVELINRIESTDEGGNAQGGGGEDRKNKNLLLDKETLEKRKKAIITYEKKIKEAQKGVDLQYEKWAVERAHDTDQEIMKLGFETAKEIEELDKKIKELAEERKKIYGGSDKENIAAVKAEVNYDQQKSLIRQTGLDKEAQLRAEQYKKYLEDYGTFEQRRYEIAQRYAKKIAELSGLDKERAIRERDSELAALNAEAVALDIDWATVFGDLGGMLTEQLQETLKRLQEYTKSEEFKNASPESQKAVMDAIEKFKEHLGGGKIKKELFTDVGTAVQNFRDKTLELNEAREEEKLAYEELRKAQEKLAEATTEAEIQIAQANLNAAQATAAGASSNTQEKEEQVTEAQEHLTDATNKAQGTLNGFADGLSKMTGGSLKDAMSGLHDVLVAGGLEATSALAQALSGGGPIGMIIGAVFDLLDILKDGIGNLLANIVDSLLGIVATLIEDTLGGGIIIKLGKALYNGLRNVFESLLKALSFGMFKGNWQNSNAEEVAKTMNRLTARNELLTKSIDTLTDEMKKSRGAKSIEQYKTAKAAQEEKNANLMEMARTQAGYHGSHHSFAYYWAGFTEEEIARLEELSGTEWSGSLWDLTPEQAEILLSMPDLVEKLQNTGEGGYGGRFVEKLQAYADEAGKLEELTASLNEALTGVSFDSFYSSYVSMLQNLDRKNQDFADNMQDYLYKALISNFVGEEMEAEIKSWYEAWAKAMEDGMSTDERDTLMKQYEDIAKKGDAKARELEEMIYGEGGKAANAVDQGTTKGFEGMSQETADELNGRFTALQIAGERTAENTSLIYATMEELRAYQVVNNTIAEESQVILANSYLELQGINTNTRDAARTLIAVEERLSNIERRL